MTTKIKTNLLTATLFGLCATSAYADENDILVYARQSAIIAGGAQYCRADEDMIDEFVSKAEARIAYLAKDDYEKVLGKLEFKNVLAGASAKEPQKGCDAFVSDFEQTVRDAR
ncbi:MAG: hypothetical protein HWE25_09915 [Alphaproteobacteria bacterium]|nr:hypothetical protein [Alphaproteobacteria bacterium]